MDLPPAGSSPRVVEEEVSESSTSCASPLKGIVRTPGRRNILGTEVRRTCAVGGVRPYRPRVAVLLLSSETVIDVVGLCG